MEKNMNYMLIAKPVLPTTICLAEKRIVAGLVSGLWKKQKRMICNSGMDTFDRIRMNAKRCRNRRRRKS